jgi:hypothetical protein
VPFAPLASMRLFEIESEVLLVAATVAAFCTLDVAVTLSTASDVFTPDVLIALAPWYVAGPDTVCALPSLKFSVAAAEAAGYNDARNSKLAATTSGRRTHESTSPQVAACSRAQADTGDDTCDAMFMMLLESSRTGSATAVSVLFRDDSRIKIGRFLRYRIYLNQSCRY